MLLFGLAPPESGAAVADPVDAAGLPEIEVPRTEAELKLFLRQRFGVIVPEVQVCPTHVAPWTAVKNAFFAESPAAVWKASRGLGGKSFTLSVLGLAEAVALRCDVNLLGGSGEQSQRILESMDKLWAFDGAPRWLLDGDPGTRRTKFADGHTITALTASQRSVRGPHPQRLRIDEVDEVEIEILKSATGQPMSKGWVQSHIVFSSTHQYPDAGMAWALKEAAEKGWPVFEWCFKETCEPHGWLTQAEMLRKRSMMPASTWRIEVELQEPSIEGRAISTEWVDRSFREDLTLEEPVEGARYATGADWAKKVNETVIWTFRTDVRPMRLVAFTRTAKLPWPVMVATADAQVRRYPGPFLHDATGLGTVVSDLITVPFEDFVMVGRPRQDLLSEYIAGIEHGDVEMPRELPGIEPGSRDQKAYHAHRFATVADIYTQHGHLPDSVAAAALAYRAATIPEPVSAVREPEPQLPTGRFGVLGRRGAGRIFHGR